eukprot:CAMPEP_0182420430 /NCGR_PEP_ID=MMETSP1167-20130531/5226_1 /TAXON_ID=2988 /ORGANISM="Mallomonas Sp, Strain CCMP3275" /LENGTH=216 /DNA_ID=CAMNT_0024596363 /DNA_START=335 /DNA_END=985 /DNA_ORIENTATION=+
MAIALEWDSQIDNTTGIEPSAMPLMTLASTAIDQVSLDMETARRNCLQYLPTDTALFLATPEDKELLRLQRKHFRPLLRWLRKSYGVDLNTSSDMSGRISHSTQAIRRVQLIVNQLDPFTLTALQSWTMDCKSLVIALALLAGETNVSTARLAARLEEESQVAVWGVVEGGHDMDRLNLAVGLSSAQTFMLLLWDADEMKEMLSTWAKIIAIDSNI